MGVGGEPELGTRIAMAKIIVAYTVAGLVLFGALFAALALSGVMKPGPTQEEIATAEAEAEAEEQAAAQAPPPATSPAEYTPPTLQPERQYRISHETPIYSSPARDEATKQQLPAGGYFIFDQVLPEPAGPWFEITVSDGVNNFTQYLFAPDLRWKVVTPQYSDQETNRAQSEVFLKQWQEMRAARTQERLAAAAAAEPEQPQSLTFQEWWALKGDQLGGATTANLVISAVLAALATLLILGSLAMLTVLRREHTWSRPVMHDEYEEDADAEQRGNSGPAGDHLYDEAEEPQLEDRYRL